MTSSDVCRAIDDALEAWRDPGAPMLDGVEREIVGVSVRAGMDGLYDEVADAVWERAVSP